MSKHFKEENEVLNLIGSPETLLSLMVKKKADRDWAMTELQQGGPRHKQVYSALLLHRMHALVNAVEKQTSASFSVQKGTYLTSHKDEVEVPLPLALPSLNKGYQQEIAEALSPAPAHEIIAFNALLQAIEWSLAALAESRLPHE